MTTAPDILSFIKQHPAGKIKLAVTDIDGILRGKYISVDKFHSVAESGLGFCDVVFGWDSSDLAYDNVKYTGWHTGYPDAQARLDMNTFRKIPWENDLPFFLGDFTSDKDNEITVCPRSLLKRILADCNQMGFKPYFSQEFEWFK